MVEGQGIDGLRRILDQVRPAVKSGVIILGGVSDGKAAFVASVSDDWVKRGIHAGKLIGQVAKTAGGGGGGQPNKAQAGGKNPDKVPEAIAQIPELLAG